MSYCITGKGPCQCQPDEGDYCPHSSEVAALQSELTSARDEGERLRGRVAELGEATELAESPCRAFYKQGGDGGWKAYSAVQNALKVNSRAWLLRKQAEAVEAEAKELMPGPCWQPDDPAPEYTAACEVCADFKDYAKRLRHQADEAEKAGS